jgi:hypothetical protein
MLNSIQGKAGPLSLFSVPSTIPPAQLVYIARKEKA